MTNTSATSPHPGQGTPTTASAAQPRAAAHRAARDGRAVPAGVRARPRDPGRAALPVPQRSGGSRGARHVGAKIARRHDRAAYERAGRWESGWLPVAAKSSGVARSPRATAKAPDDHAPEPRYEPGSLGSGAFHSRTGTPRATAPGIRACRLGWAARHWWIVSDKLY